MKYKIDYLYLDYNGIYHNAQEVRGTDCLLYCGDGWVDVYGGFSLRLLHDETYFVRSYELYDIEAILSVRDTADGLTICLPSEYSDEDTRIILDTITAQTGLQSYRYIFKFLGVQEWLLE
ncbi:MAG: hypothetical protein NC086_00420 [Alistipes sp.]|nr:hypothetical protein [Alistipes sp.]